jgi:hypothetical protein
MLLAPMVVTMDASRRNFEARVIKRPPIQLSHQKHNNCVIKTDHREDVAWLYVTE